MTYSRLSCWSSRLNHIGTIERGKSSYMKVFTANIVPWVLYMYVQVYIYKRKNTNEKPYMYISIYINMCANLCCIYTSICTISHFIKTKVMICSNSHHFSFIWQIIKASDGMHKVVTGGRYR
jgi:hypothetical protein